MSLSRLPVEVSLGFARNAGGPEAQGLRPCDKHIETLRGIPESIASHSGLLRHSNKRDNLSETSFG